MIRPIVLLSATLLLNLFATLAPAQTLEFATVDRPPFAFPQGDKMAGFSIDLMDRLAEDLGREVRYTESPNFSHMLGRVINGDADGAIANISITAEREVVMDFSLPIYESGLQIMVAGERGASFRTQFFKPEIALWILAAIGILFASGMLMWVFERRAQPYFERPAREAIFPSFWWALNLVVNGGFEERQPRSPMGRVLGVLLVISSLFLVSFFVARITTAMTVSALISNVNGLSDLDTRRVGSVENSTASVFLASRDIRHDTYPGFAELVAEFESGGIDAVVFDGPVLKYYISQRSDDKAYLVDRVFRKEDYGIVLPAGSDLREPINQAILKMRENGSYDRIVRKWFGE
ncbi:transporter substrate-binding domain-containing protein [Actibacterium ureilyticum]|uniref:transporter substrate-binding domain-containing protein n=1 Tax=Actibacterium ureilyticum TaxID=1590614 RepID=UPI000BAAADCB|nr:transporter substrate-binding domain-containing protein [Actibacterium ureilyticum]